LGLPPVKPLPLPVTPEPPFVLLAVKVQNAPVGLYW